MPFLGRNDAWRKRLLFENVSRRLRPGRRVEVWPLLVASIFPARSSDSTSSRTDLEVPAEGLLRELVGQVAAARGVAVVGALLDPGEDLLERAVLDAEDGLALLVAQQAEAGEDRREALEVVGGEQGVERPS